MPKIVSTATVDRLLRQAHQFVTDGRSRRLAEAGAGKGMLLLV
jgi:hypothetical protein